MTITSLQRLHLWPSTKIHWSFLTMIFFCFVALVKKPLPPQVVLDLAALLNHQPLPFFDHARPEAWPTLPLAEACPPLLEPAKSG